MTVECLCECQSGTCIEVDGDGSFADPFVFDLTIDPDGDNLASCTSDGLLVEVPAVVLNPPRVTVHRGTAFEITSGTTGEAIEFDSKFIEKGGDLWDISDPTRLYAPDDGLYWISGSARWDANPTGGRYWRILHSVDSEIASVLKGANQATGESSRDSVVTPWPMAVGESVQLWLSQTSGVALNALPTGLASISFSMVRLGDA